VDADYGSWADEMEDMPLPSKCRRCLPIPGILAIVLQLTRLSLQPPNLARATARRGEHSAPPPAWAMAFLVALPADEKPVPRGTDLFLERRDTYAHREQLPLPTQPPYTAHLANLSFDATQGDIQDFFQDCEVVSVRIVEDKLDHKPKGFGYVEFKTLEGLKAALALGGNSLAGRQVRVSVAEPRMYRSSEQVKRD